MVPTLARWKRVGLPRWVPSHGQLGGWMLMHVRVLHSTEPQGHQGCPAARRVGQDFPATCPAHAIFEEWGDRGRVHGRLQIAVGLFRVQSLADQDPIQALNPRAAKHSTRSRQFFRRGFLVEVLAGCPEPIRLLSRLPFWGV